MARVSRYRTRTESFTGTTYTHLGPLITDPIGNVTPRTISNLSAITDFIGRPVTPSGLASLQYTGIVRFNARVLGSTNKLVRFVNVPTNSTNGIPAVSELAVPNGWLLDTIAASNPSRPSLNPPELLQNIYELPAMIRNLWKFLLHPKTIATPRGAANEYLGVQFGWLPMIKDIKELLDLQAIIDKRMRELHQLYSGRGLRRRVKFTSDISYGTCSDSFAASGTVLKIESDYIIRRTSWATIRWKPTSAPPYHPYDMRYRSTIMRTVLGLTPEGMAKGLWAVIPWTWLIGWFTNIGKVLNLRSNTIPATWSEACFMRKYERFIIPKAGSITGGGTLQQCTLSGGAVYTIRRRTTGSIPVPGLNMPLFDMFKLSILGALGIQRYKQLGALLHLR